MDFAQATSHALSAGNVAAFPLALVGGVIAAMNPCCLALYPAAAAVCCPAGPSDALRAPPLGKAAAFVLGVATTIAALGIVAASIGRVAAIAAPMRYGIAIVPIVMGLYGLGWLPWPRWTVPTFTSSVGGAFGMGAMLSLVIGPCGTPVLASVLSFAAYKHSLTYGGLLLFAYGIGSGLPLMLVGTTAGGFLNALDRTRFRHKIDAIVGGSLVVLGLYLLWRA